MMGGGGGAVRGLGDGDVKKTPNTQGYTKNCVQLDFISDSLKHMETLAQGSVHVHLNSPAEGEEL